MLAGLSDPLAMLATSFEDWAVLCAVIEKTLKLRDERDTAMVKAMGRAIGGEVAESVGRLMMQAFR